MFDERYIKTKIPIVANATTRHRWTDFVPHSLEARGEWIVPQQFLRAAWWRTVQGDTGYFIDNATRPSCFYPIEFNFAHVCWVETTWNPIDWQWDVIHLLGPQYQCDIYEPIPHVSDWGPLDGQETHNKPQSDDSNTESDASEHTSQGEISQGPNTTHTSTDPIVTDLALAAESIHIYEPMATFTMQATVQEEHVNLPPIHPQMGHRLTEDDVTIHQAAGPDIGDPPPQERPFCRQPPDDNDDIEPFFFREEAPTPGGGAPGGGTPGGGVPGGGAPGGDALGGGIPGGGAPGGGVPPGGFHVAPHRPLPRVQGTDKFIRNAPIVFMGDRTKTDKFCTQWELYWGVNNNNTLMRNAYHQAMFFLTYIQGPLINEWVIVVSCWLNQKIQNGIADDHEDLWTEVAVAFTRRFANTLERERVQAELKRGIKMKDGDLDAYIANFEQLAQKAGYHLDTPQTIDIFTDGLPQELYAKVYQFDEPRNYEEWKNAMIR